MTMNIFLGFGIICLLSLFGPGLGSLRKIVSGSKALACEDPQIVALKIICDSKPFLCGGNILDETHILTAAHCLNGSDQVFVYAGALNMKEMPIEIEMENYELHPGYELSGEAGNDMAVIKLKEPIHFTDCIKPIDLALDVDTKYENCVISGWGKVKGEHNVSSEPLQTSPIKMIAEDKCLEIIPAEQKDQLICVGEDVKDGVSACHGDSGGPLMCEHPMTGRPTLVGVASWGSTNCDKSVSVYTKVSFYKNWIDTMMEA